MTVSVHVMFADKNSPEGLCLRSYETYSAQSFNVTGSTGGKVLHTDGNTEALINLLIIEIDTDTSILLLTLGVTPTLTFSARKTCEIS